MLRRRHGRKNCIRCRKSCHAPSWLRATGSPACSGFGGLLTDSWRGCSLAGPGWLVRRQILPMRALFPALLTPQVAAHLLDGPPPRSGGRALVWGFSVKVHSKSIASIFCRQMPHIMLTPRVETGPAAVNTTATRRSPTSRSGSVRRAGQQPRARTIVDGIALVLVISAASIICQMRPGICLWIKLDNRHPAGGFRYRWATVSREHFVTRSLASPAY